MLQNTLANNDYWKSNNKHWYWKIIWQWNKWLLKKNFAGVYSPDSITRYLKFYDIIKEKRAKYPFAIFRTDRENKSGTHWWSILDIYPKKDLLLFDSFGFVGFKQFIIDSDSSVIDKMLFSLGKKTQTIVLILYLSPFLSKDTKKLKKKTHWKT